MAERVVDFSAGSLVRARGREWVVLPESTADMLMVRPVGGLDDEVTGIVRGIEDVAPATFSVPDISKPGDHNACRLLRDAARLSTRNAAGPFRSFGRIAVEPRPYQLVPLLMALKLDPVRLLIADDVGIGKTVEALLVARELLDRAEITRMAVLCPPHLAEQWQRELSDKFHIDAELVLSSTIQRLERAIRSNTTSVFKHYPFLVISTDFVKQTRHRDEFLRDCPNLVIVDEAHGCTIAGQPGKARQQRYDLIRRLSSVAERHLILVTATPNSGNEDAFRSLLGLLNDQFAKLPLDMADDERSKARDLLSRHLVQRRRADIREYLGVGTIFPERVDGEASYQLSAEYKALFKKVLGFATEMVSDKTGNARQRRVRWWSALALLRAMASSPAAAVSTLRNRATTAESEDEEQADELGRRGVMDETEDDTTGAVDFTPGGDASEETASAATTHDRLLAFAREAEKLTGKKDAKLQKVITIVGDLLKKGHNPIVFCRFIDTAEYVAAALRDEFAKNCDVAAVTGLLPPKEREDRIRELPVPGRSHILVCTDCLSEGINLQDHFDAIVHYDLSWNPTRHEQREGRVDRFGQSKPTVRVVTYFGVDNQIDGIVLEVLLRKHKQIKSQLGVSVSVPGSSEQVIEALFEGMLLRGGDDLDNAPLIPELETWLKPKKDEIHSQWDVAVKNEDRARKSLSRFAQRSIKTDEVQAQLQAVRDAIGAGPATRQFITDVLHLAKVPVLTRPRERIEVKLTNEVPRSLRQAIGTDKPFNACFDPPAGEDEVCLSRTHPVTEAIASWVFETALDPVDAPDQAPIARRCGVIRTKAVSQRITLLLVRFRYHLVSRSAAGDRPLMAEEVRVLAYRGNASAPQWLPDSEIDPLLIAAPSDNTSTSLARQQLDSLISQVPTLTSHIHEQARLRAETLREAHSRVRETGKSRVTVEPILPVDLLGCYILIP
jgi:superfamily II DNA or RNA helicase